MHFFEAVTPSFHSFIHGTRKGRDSPPSFVNLGKVMWERISPLEASLSAMYKQPFFIVPQQRRKERRYIKNLSQVINVKCPPDWLTPRGHGDSPGWLSE